MNPFQSRPTLTPRAALVAAMLSIMLTISGCSRASSEPPVAESAALPPPAAASAAATPGTGPLAPSDKDRKGSAVEGRMVISQVTLSLRASPDEAADAASRLIAARGGYVASKETTRENDVAARVDLVLRVPAKALEPVLSELRKTGTLLSESQSGQDVTDEFTDTEAQLRAKRTLEQRLLTIVASAKTVKEMLEVEAELSRVRADIERLDGHARSLSAQVEFATIRVSFVAPSQPVVDEPELVSSRLRRAVSEGQRVFVHVVAGIIVVIGAMLPFATLGGAVIGAAALIRKRRRAAATANPV